MIEELVERGFAYESDGDVYFRVARYPGVRPPRGQRLDQVEEQEPNPLKEDPRDFALWKAKKPRRGHVVGVAVGAGPAGLAHRVLGDVREAPRAGVRDPRRRPRPRLPAPRERDRAVARARPTASRTSGCTTGCSSSAARRCTSRSATSSRCRNVLDTWGRETLLVFFLTGHWRKPLDFSDATLEAAAARAEGFREVFRNASEPAPDGGVGALRGRARRRLQHAGRARGHARVARPRAPAARARRLRARVARRGGRGAAGGRRARRAAGRARGRRATSTRPIGSAARSRRPAGTCATRPTASGSCRADDHASSSTGGTPRASCTAARGEVLEIVGHGARGEPDPVARLRPAAAREAGARALRGGGDARPPGRRRLVRAVPLRRRVRAREAETPLLVCLDQVTDPHNLGAVVRSAEGAGATGVVVPAHGSVRVTPAVCRASAGAVEHLPVAVVPEPRALSRATSRATTCGRTPPTRRGRCPLWDADLTGGVALVFGAEGKGVRPLVRRTCDATVSIPLGGQGRLAQRLRRRRRAALRGAAPADGSPMAEPTLYLFDGYNLLHAGDVRGSRRARRHARELRRGCGARAGVVVFDGVGEERDDRAARDPASRRTRTTCSSGSPPRTARPSSSASSPRTPPCAGRRGQEVRKLASRAFLAELAPRRARRARADAAPAAASATGSTPRRASSSSGSAAASRNADARPARRPARGPRRRSGPSRRAGYACCGYRLGSRPLVLEAGEPLEPASAGTSSTCRAASSSRAGARPGRWSRR